MKMTQNAPRVHFCEKSRITTPSARPSCSRDTLTYFYARNAGALSAPGRLLRTTWYRDKFQGLGRTCAMRPRR